MGIECRIFENYPRTVKIRLKLMKAFEGIYSIEMLQTLPADMI